MSNDPTPPSAPLPRWGVYLQKEVDVLKKELATMKSSHKSDTMANIHLLSQVAKSVQELHVDVVKLNKQIWGAIKQLRKKGK